MTGEPKHEADVDTDASTASRRSRVVRSALVALLCGALGIAIVTQVRDTGSGDTLDSARPADLLVLLDTLHQRESALRQEIASLEQTLSALRASDSGSGAALEEATSRLSALSIQVGTVGATGPGVMLTVDDPRGSVGADVLLDQLQELRAAGAEAIQIGGRVGDHKKFVRIGVDSWITGLPGGIRVDDQALAAPYELIAIGDPPTLAAALNIPGGAVDAVARSGGKLTISKSDHVSVDATREVKTPQEARPGG